MAGGLAGSLILPEVIAALGALRGHSRGFGLLEAWAGGAARGDDLADATTVSAPRRRAPGVALRALCRVRAKQALVAAALAGRADILAPRPVRARCLEVELSDDFCRAQWRTRLAAPYTHQTLAGL